MATSRWQRVFEGETVHARAVKNGLGDSARQVASATGEELENHKLCIFFFAVFGKVSGVSDSLYGSEKVACPAEFTFSWFYLFFVMKSENSLS